MEAIITAGYHPAGLPANRPGAFLPYPTTGNETRRLLTLIEQLTGQSGETGLELPVTAQGSAEAAELLHASGLGEHSYVCIHPGARLASRRWPAERFAAVGRALSDCGYGVVVTGTAGERSLTGVVSGLNARCADLAGKTDLSALSAIVAGSKLVISNDTGMAHVAAGVGTSSVVVASGSDTTRWAVEDRASNITLAHPVECRPCMHEICPIGHPCALGITVPMVVAAARHLLSQTAAPR
jgi:ADP-heptose:LPS heptosyltransferase